MRIAIVTDAWAPQVNGVVRTLEAVTGELRAAGHDILAVSPEGRRSVPCPTYPEIRLALTTPAAIGRSLASFGADAIHVATEGPLGLAARYWCLARRIPFTTAYHTQFPDYVARRTGADPQWIWRYVRWFHAPAAAVLASTPSIERDLRAHGLAQVRRWGRGVSSTFAAAVAPDAAIRALPGPVLLYVGRVAVEKNVEAFLACAHPGTKVVVGDGPARGALEARFPEARFLGSRYGADLAAAYRAADVFVFPSRTDTFGLVMIEAMACGTPVAAYPVTGPVDVLTPPAGAMRFDLDDAIADALALDRASVAAEAGRFTWAASAAQFLDALVPIGSALRAA